VSKENNDVANYNKAQMHELQNAYVLLEKLYTKNHINSTRDETAEWFFTGMNPLLKQMLT
jgi:hypothetical protein